MSGSDRDAVARLGGRVGRGLVEVTDDLRVLDGSGMWAVVMPYTGQPVLARFVDWTPAEADEVSGAWRGPEPGSWTSSASAEEYCAAVDDVRQRIAAGDLYQANVCRVMSADLGPESDIAGLHACLEREHPAPYAGMVRLPRHGVHVATASPELFLRRSGDVLTSGPIKGTGRTASDLREKDRAENVMIVDLVRNDLSRVSRTGSVTVSALLREEHHPGLVHLVSDIQGVLRPGTRWSQIVSATFPPGSVTGAPKVAALSVIDDVESAPRSVYCGAIGWVDADRREACLAVAIRTFWIEDARLHFGTGAGITWGSDPVAEWRETELKAERLIAAAATTR